MTAADRPGGRDDIDARFAEIISGYDLDWDQQRPETGRPASAGPTAAGSAPTTGADGPVTDGDVPRSPAPESPVAESAVTDSAVPDTEATDTTADPELTSSADRPGQDSPAPGRHRSLPADPSAAVPVRDTGLDPHDFEPMRLLDPQIFGPGSPTGRDLDDAAGLAAHDRQRGNPQTEREWRRAQRRLEREIELEAFASEKDRLQREYRDDPEGWTPPPPPPVPKPHRRTVVGLILILLGALIMLRPGWFSVPHDVSLVLGLIAAVGGLWMLVQNLRRRHTDPIDSTWDDGAEV